MKRLIATLLVLLTCPVPNCLAASDQTTDPPIFVTGTRVVDLRNTSGYLARYTTIPSASLFSTTGGKGQPCSFVASASGVTSDGQHYVAGQTVYSDHWLFVETDIVSFGDIWTYEPSRVSRGPLKNAYRSFSVYCDSQDYFLH